MARSIYLSNNYKKDLFTSMICIIGLPHSPPGGLKRLCTFLIVVIYELTWIEPISFMCY